MNPSIKPTARKEYMRMLTGGTSGLTEEAAQALLTRIESRIPDYRSTMLSEPVSDEHARVVEALQAGRDVVIFGNTGVGKSHLLWRLLQLAERKSLLVADVAGEAVFAQEVLGGELASVRTSQDDFTPREFAAASILAFDDLGGGLAPLLLKELPPFTGSKVVVTYGSNTYDAITRLARNGDSELLQLTNPLLVQVLVERPREGAFIHRVLIHNS